MDSALPRGWDHVDQTVTRRPVTYIFLTALFAFLAGFGVAVLLGLTVSRIRFGLTLYSTVGSLICTALFGYIVYRAIRTNR